MLYTLNLYGVLNNNGTLNHLGLLMFDGSLYPHGFHCRHGTLNYYGLLKWNDIVSLNYLRFSGVTLFAHDSLSSLSLSNDSTSRKKLVLTFFIVGQIGVTSLYELDAE